MVAKQQSRAWVRARRPRTGKQGKKIQLGPETVHSLQAVGARKGGLALLAPKVVPFKKAWLHSPCGARGRWVISASFPIQIYSWQVPMSSPRGISGSVCDCKPSTGHISSGTLIHPFLIVVKQGCQRGTCISVHSSRCMTICREKATSSSYAPTPYS